MRWTEVDLHQQRLSVTQRNHARVVEVVTVGEVVIIAVVGRGSVVDLGLNAVDRLEVAGRLVEADAGRVRRWSWKRSTK